MIWFSWLFFGSLENLKYKELLLGPHSDCSFCLANKPYHSWAFLHFMLCMCRNGIRFRNMKCDRNKIMSIGIPKRKINLSYLRFLTCLCHIHPEKHLFWAVIPSRRLKVSPNTLVWRYVRMRDRYSQAMTGAWAFLIKTHFWQNCVHVHASVHLSVQTLFCFMATIFCSQKNNSGVGIQLRNQYASLSALGSDLKLWMGFLFPFFCELWKKRRHKHMQARSKWNQIKWHYFWPSDPTTVWWIGESQLISIIKDTKEIWD